MIPYIKKKITSFIKDESGKISKKNLIAGAIILSGISSFAKNIKAAHFPGSSVGLPGLDSGSNSWHCNPPVKNYLAGTEGHYLTTYCHSNGGSCKHDHTNRVSANHANTNKIFHRNIPDFEYDKSNKVIVSKHNHHGQHASGQVGCGSGGQSHCNY